MKEKIGVGIVTYNRPHLLEKLYYSIGDNVDYLIIVNDGDEINDKLFCDKWVEHARTVGVGKGVGYSKNECLKYLLQEGCDYIFLIEDDIFIKDGSVFDAYIEASKKSGIQHFNFSQHGVMNKEGYTNSGSPNPRTIIDFGDIKIPLYHHCVGAFSFYTKQCLNKVGLLDERYYNAAEHVDHTLMIIKNEMHPPFWYFADIENSNAYIGDEPWMVSSSTIFSRPDHNILMANADIVFMEKHGCTPVQIPDTTKEHLIEKIKTIKKVYGSNTLNV